MKNNKITTFKDNITSQQLTTLNQLNLATRKWWLEIVENQNHYHQNLVCFQNAVSAIKTWAIVSFHIEIKARKFIYPEVIKQISQVLFTKLMKLHLRGCAILNIEDLQLINAKEMVRLELIDNHIANFRAFKKCSMPKLKELNLKLNKCSEIKDVFQVIDCKTRQMVLTFDEFDGDEDMNMTSMNRIVNDLKFCLKTEFGFHKIYVESDERIAERKWGQMQQERENKGVVMRYTNYNAM